MGQQDSFDRRGAEVLAVHPQPVRRAAREVAEAVRGKVCEVAAPVHAVADPLRVGGSAAPPSRNANSGTLPSGTPMWKESGRHRDFSSEAYTPQSRTCAAHDQERSSNRSP
ncbi:hypothetical protein [Saccharopolyspora spinosa]|uniref:hypothetical protein n=1 Tax=Saccharopolyspora spinosa TaxID=60894 RepID=UPI000A2F0A18|nr:hypothetical protein [Saccharopolyspora spinosa]